MTSFFPYRPAAILKINGVDAPGFIQGQFTNDLKQPAGSVTYGLFLNQKGKLVADAQVLRLSEKEFLVTSLFSPAGIIRCRLEEYIVADDVIIVEETPVTHGLALWGSDCGRILMQLVGVTLLAGQFVRKQEVLIFAGRRTSGENYEIIGPEREIRVLGERLRELGCRDADANQTEFVRIGSGIPAVPRDIGPGDLPNEGNLEAAAISYTKGCYLGQEVMARLKNLGQVRRRLHVVAGRGNPPPVRAPLYQGEGKVGEIRSVANQGGEFVAMAMLTLLSLNREAGLSLAPNTQPVLKIAAHG